MPHRQFRLSESLPTRSEPDLSRALHAREVTSPASASTLERRSSESAFSSSRSCSPRASGLRILEPPSTGIARAGTKCALQEANSGSLFSASYQRKSDPPELRRMFNDAMRERADAALASAGGYFLAHRQLIVDLAAANRLPVMYAFRDFIEAGGLAAYGPDLSEAADRLASHVDQILKGARPGDVPVHQASKFALLINGATAKALGLIDPAHPPRPRRRGDRVSWREVLDPPYAGFRNPLCDRLPSGPKVNRRQACPTAADERSQGREP